jgi:DNA-binding transcriptional ArsR family regulator
MNEAWSYPLNSHEKIVLLALADCANDEGVAYPSYDSLMKKTGMAKATLAKHLKLLRGLGLIKSENHSEFGKGKKVNVYTISSTLELSYSSISELKDKIKELRKKYASTKSSTLEPAKVQNVDPKSSTLEHEPPYEPSVKETSVEKNKQKKSTFALPDSVDKNRWSEWMKIRSRKRAANTDYAKNLLLSTLLEAGKQGYNVNAVMDLAIKRSWAGLEISWLENTGLLRTSSSDTPRRPLI